MPPVRQACALGTLIVLTLGSAFAYKFNSLQKPTNIIGNRPNKLVTPLIVEDKGDDPSAIYYLQVKCSQKAKTFFRFEPFDDFCSDRILKGPANAINRILGAATIMAPPLRNDQLGEISYLLWKEKSAAAPKVAVQQFTLKSQINLFPIKEIVEVLPWGGEEFEETVLTIDKALVSSSSEFEVQPVASETKIPLWLRFKLINSSLIAYGTPPDTFDKSLKLSLKLHEKKSGLFSEPFLLVVATSSRYQLDRLLISFVAFFMVFCLLIGIWFYVFGVQAIAVSPGAKEQSDAEVDDSRSLNVFADSMKEFQEDDLLCKLSTRTSVGKDNQKDQNFMAEEVFNIRLTQQDFEIDSSLDRIVIARKGSSKTVDLAELDELSDKNVHSEGPSSP